VAKPVVDGIERDLKGTAEVVRIDLLSPVGREAAARFGVQGIPALVIVDGGRVIYSHMGMPNRSEVVSKLRAAEPVP
jgi:thioredoxin-like negative regulator of GroEL